MTAEAQLHLIRGAIAAKAACGVEVLCSWCRRVRGEDGVWSAECVDVSQHRFGHFTHGICPTCLEEHFRELARIADKSPELSLARPDTRSLWT